MPNGIYQYSILAALINGICRHGTTIQYVLSHGNHGIGTVQGLNGELIILDGVAYYFLSEGPLRPVKPTNIVPYAIVTRFRLTLAKYVPRLSMSSLYENLASLLPAEQNAFLSIRLSASFSRIQFRVIPAQSNARETLLELVKKQRIQECTPVDATFFGFWSPMYSSAFSVSGFHLHFLAADRSKGGLVIDFEATNGQLCAARVSDYRVELPTSEDFRKNPI